MRRQLSAHFCSGKVPLCTYCSAHVIKFLLRHPAGIYPLECPFCRYVRAPWVLGHSMFLVSDAPWHTSWVNEPKSKSKNRLENETNWIGRSSSVHQTVDWKSRRPKSVKMLNVIASGWPINMIGVPFIEEGLECRWWHSKCMLHWFGKVFEIGLKWLQWP